MQRHVPWPRQRSPSAKGALAWFLWLLLAGYFRIGEAAHPGPVGAFAHGLDDPEMAAFGDKGDGLPIAAGGHAFDDPDADVFADLLSDSGLAC